MIKSLSININKSIIEKDYNFFKKKAHTEFNENNISKSLKYIKTAATLAYHFPFIYSDDEFENLLFQISKKLCPISNVKSTITQDKYIFYDSFGFSNQGLSQQYIRALIFNNITFLYVLEEQSDYSNDILNELKLYPNCEIFIMDKMQSDISKITNTYNKIVNYNASIILLHFSPMTIIGNCIFSNYKYSTKYFINLTDHSYWIGKNCFDYCIEFRNYGINISKHQRNINHDKLLYYQYYPLMDNIQEIYRNNNLRIHKNNVKIFTGGSLYKYYGDNDIFFTIIKKILNDNTEAIIYILGRGNTKPFLKFINENSFQSRIFLLGHRSDYTTLISEADIYLTSYPIGGGLMPLIAASNKIPIVCYTSINLPLNSIDDFFTDFNYDITYNNLDSFYKRIKYLINNKDVRIQFGKNLHKIIPNEYSFNKNFYKIFENNTIKDRQENSQNTDKILDVYIESENIHMHNYYLIILYNLKRLIFLHPIYTIKSIHTILFYHQDIILNKFSNKLNNIFK
jgi:hypothetical protein